MYSYTPSKHTSLQRQSNITTRRQTMPLQFCLFPGYLVWFLSSTPDNVSYFSPLKFLCEFQLKDSEVGSQHLTFNSHQKVMLCFYFVKGNGKCAKSTGSVLVRFKLARDFSSFFSPMTKPVPYILHNFCNQCERLHAELEKFSNDSFILKNNKNFNHNFHIKLVFINKI